MQYPWIVSLKCLDHVLEYSFAPKFLWQMVLKQSPVTAFPFDKGKEGGKGVSSEFHTSGKVHADSEFGKEKKKVGQALVRVSACCCSVEELTGPGTVAAETLISEVSMLPQPFCDFYLPFLISR